MPHPGHLHGGHGPVVRKIKHDINKKPFMVIWEVTRACQLVCKHCRAEAQHRPSPRQLSNAEGKNLLEQLASYEKPRPMVVFTGGDCFERQDLVELVQYGTDLGLHISISPSVTPLFTKERLVALRKAGGKAMSVSLDGASAKTHDAFRGFAGTFEKTVEATKIINEVGFRLQINTTLTKGNIHEAPQMLKNAIDLNAFMWYTFMLVPTGRGSHLQMLNPSEREDVMHWQHDVSDRIAIKTTEAPQYRRIAIQRADAADAGVPPEELARPAERGELYHWLTNETARIMGEHAPNPRTPRPPMAINSGSGFAFVDHEGNVCPSGFLPIAVGNIRENPFDELYRETKVMKDLRSPDQFEGKCGACGFNRICGGSRATAYAMTGDYMAADPNCIYIPDAWAAKHS
ncbi:TIGR04053 family radical SAM/SPASM domain-containing protein [Propionimicrobium lymphophilum]|uniref:TIGR04053 family radical SAM/SPASM domain-containing protein n=1 Tax=Propionimicrobium lymphophilum TaxID=33012 RepID=UPI00040C72E2|nr:TIGR04053 family radical SAM/SPASM domain-containing protein [Propionimicrobium lymphophilum]